MVSSSVKGFFIRELCRDINEQINNVRRELMNLESIGILKSKEDEKKKYYALDHSCPLYREITEMFLKNYNVLEAMKDFFKGRKGLDLVTISEGVLDFRGSNSNNVVDIFIIGELDRIEFNNFLEKVFFWKKVKYAIMRIDDFMHRLEYNDKLVISILSQQGNVFLKDRHSIEETIQEKLRAIKILSK